MFKPPSKLVIEPGTGSRLAGLKSATLLPHRPSALRMPALEPAPLAPHSSDCQIFLELALHALAHIWQGAWLPASPSHLPHPVRAQPCLSRGPELRPFCSCPEG